METLRSLGNELETPDRPNPGRWHGTGTATVTAVACSPGAPPSLAIGVAEACRLATLAGRREPVAGDGAPITVDAVGAALAVVVDAGPTRRPPVDEEMSAEAARLLKTANVALASALAAAGSPRVDLAGLRLLFRRYDPASSSSSTPATRARSTD